MVRDFEIRDARAYLMRALDRVGAEASDEEIEQLCEDAARAGAPPVDDRSGAFDELRAALLRDETRSADEMRRMREDIDRLQAVVMQREGVVKEWEQHRGRWQEFLVREWAGLRERVTKIETRVAMVGGGSGLAAVAIYELGRMYLGGG